MDLTGFADEVSSDGPVTIAGLSTRGGAVPGVRVVRAPVGIELILRTRPRSRNEQWFRGRVDPVDALARLYRPTSVLWDGTTTWVLLEGDERDVVAESAALDVEPAAGPPPLPVGGRWSIDPGRMGELRGTFVVEVGVGVVHHVDPSPPTPIDPNVRALHRRIKDRFDPTGRLNPGVDVLEPLADAG